VIVSTENKNFDEAIKAQSNAKFPDSITLTTLLDITGRSSQVRCLDCLTSVMIQCPE